MKRQSALRLPQQDRSSGEAMQETDSIRLTSVKGTRTQLQVRILFLLVIALLLGSASSLRAATVTAMWNANSESDLAGYKLSYGTQSGVYTTTLDVGNVTSRVLTLTGGQRYYFAVQAYNTSAMTSVFSSPEVFFDVPASASITSLAPTSGPVGTSVTITGTNFGATKGTSTRHLQRHDRHADDVVGDEHRRAGPGRRDHRATSSSPSAVSPATASRSRGGDRRRASRAWPRRAGRSARR